MAYASLKKWEHPHILQATHDKKIIYTFDRSPHHMKMA